MCTLATGLSVWRPCCRLWCHWLSLWQPAVPPVDAGSSHWQHLSVLMFIPYEYWSSFVSINATPIYVHWGWGCRFDDLSPVAPRVVFVTACGATGRCGVVILTAPPCSSVCFPRIYMLSFRRVHTYWYFNSLALRPNGQHFSINFCILQAVPWNPNWKMSVLFRCWLGAVQASSHYRSQWWHRSPTQLASPEQNCTLPHSMKVEKYLYTNLFLFYTVSYQRYSYLWFYMYIYSIIVLRITSLLLSSRL